MPLSGVGTGARRLPVGGTFPEEDARALVLRKTELVLMARTELCVVPLPPLHVPLCALLLLPPARSASAFTAPFACRLLFEVSLCRVLPHRSLSVELSLPAPQSVSPLRQVGAPDVPTAWPLGSWVWSAT